MTISASARTRFGYWGYNTRRVGGFNRAVIVPLQPGRISAVDGALTGAAGADTVLFRGAAVDGALTGAAGGDT